MATNAQIREFVPKRSAVAAWIIYDVGSTMFFVGVVGLFFPLWVTQVMSGDDATVGFTLAVAMALNLVVGPVIGVFSDQARRRVPYLVVSTMVCVGATLALGGDNLNLALGLFALANVAAGSCVIVYNTLLVEVSTRKNRGRIGGLGVGIGYLGAIIAVAIGLIFVQSDNHLFGFRAIGILFLIISLPLFFLLRERPKPDDQDFRSDQANGVFRQLKHTLGNLRRFPGLPRFLIARFWYMWSINTATHFAILYGTDTVGFSARKVELIYLVGIVVAIPSGFIWGVINDHIGPRKSLSVILVLWILTLLASAAIPRTDLPGEIWLVIGVFAGFTIAGLWASDRPYMIRLTSERYLGQFFGLHSMIGRMSAMVGPFMWGFLSVTLGLGQTAAVISLAGSAFIALILIQGANDKPMAKDENV